MAKLYGEISSNALLTLDKSFSRALGQPLDSTEVYYTLSAAQTYAASNAAYVGQKIVVIDVNDNNKVTHYSIIDTSGTLKKLGEGEQIQVDWDQENSQALDFIKNKPNIDNIVITKTSYTNTEPLLSNVGGILASNHTDGFNNVPLDELITELLYPYTAPAINSFSLSPAAGVREKNIGVTVNSATVTVTKKSKSIKNVSLYRGDSLLQSNDNPNITSNTSITFTLTNEVLNGASNVSYYAKVTDDNNTTVTSGAATYSFVYPYFYGVVTSGATVDSTTILGFTKDVAARGNKSYKFTTNNECPVIAYPKEYGDLKSIIDPNNFTQTWAKSEVTVNNGSNISNIQYYVYVGGASTAPNTVYKFNY